MEIYVKFFLLPYFLILMVSIKILSYTFIIIVAYHSFKHYQLMTAQIK